MAYFFGYDAASDGRDTMAGVPPRRWLQSYGRAQSFWLQEVELVTLNGDRITTLRMEAFVNLTVEMFIEDLEQGLVLGADGAKKDDLGVFLERFSLVIRNEVIRRTMRTRRTMRLVTDYFPEGEASVQITLIKQPVSLALYGAEYYGAGTRRWTRRWTWSMDEYDENVYLD